MKISIIIPTYNESKGISKTLLELKNRQSKNSFIYETIVVDGQSNDDTVFLVSKFDHVKCVISKKGRPCQMNIGAKEATGEILYFLHADCYPPQDYDKLIINEFKNGYKAGCFKMQFDSNHLWLRFISWLTKFNHRACRGGDQSLFVCKNLFDEIGGFNERYYIFEDHEILAKLFKKTKFNVIQKRLSSSARRFEEKGILRLQLLYWVIYFKRWLGAKPEVLFGFYKKHIY